MGFFRTFLILLDMDAVVTSLHTTLVTRVLGNTFDALATTRATNDIAVSPSQTESILTESRFSFGLADAQRY